MLGVLLEFFKNWVNIRGKSFFFSIMIYCKTLLELIRFSLTIFEILSKFVLIVFEVVLLIGSYSFSRISKNSYMMFLFIRPFST